MVTEEDGRWRMRVPLMQRWLRQQGQRESNVRTALGYEAVRAERWLAMGRSLAATRAEGPGIDYT